MTKMIIGITGTLCAGKGTIVEYLQKKGFKHYSVRGYLIEEIKKRGLEINRDNMVLVANELRAKNSPSFIVEQLYLKAMKDNSDAIIESIRTPGEVYALKGKNNFYLFAVDAPRKLRYDRSQIRNDGQADGVSFKKFCEQEDKEMISDDPNKQNISKCIELADFSITNDSSLEELYEQIDEIFENIAE